MFRDAELVPDPSAETLVLEKIFLNQLWGGALNPTASVEIVRGFCIGPWERDIWQ